MVKVANLATVEGRVSVGRVETPEAFRRDILKLLLPLCLDPCLQGVLSFWVENDFLVKGMCMEHEIFVFLTVELLDVQKISHLFIDWRERPSELF